jgi:hypothetical protein
VDPRLTITTTSGDLTVTARTDMSPKVFSVAGSLATDGTVGFAAAGAASVTDIDTETYAFIGADARDTNGDLVPVSGKPIYTQGGDVIVTAETELDLVGAAGSVGIGRSAGAGLSTDIGMITVLTDAAIADAVEVHTTSDNRHGNILIDASTVIDTTGLTIGLAGGQGAALAVQAGISVVKAKTRAKVGKGAFLNAGGTIGVTADDALDMLTVAAGAAAATSGGAAVVPVAVGFIEKDTTAEVSDNAVLYADAKQSAHLASGHYSTEEDTLESREVPQQSFTRDHVNFAENTIHLVPDLGAADELKTGDKVIFFSGSGSLGGLATGETYYLRVLAGNRYTLHDSKDDAEAGTNAVDLTDKGEGDFVLAPQIRKQADALQVKGMPDDLSGDVTNQSRSSALETADQSGVIVSATSRTDITAVGAGIAGGGSLAVGLAGHVAVHDIDTTAVIRAGASVETDGDISVHAARQYDATAIGGAVAGGGTAAAGIGVAANLLTGDTAAIPAPEPAAPLAPTTTSV